MLEIHKYLKPYKILWDQVLGVVDSTRGTCSLVVGEVKVTSICKLIFARISFNIYYDKVFLNATFWISICLLIQYDA